MLQFDTESLNIRSFLTNKLHLLTILYFIFDHFTVLKQIHSLGTCRVLEHFTVFKQTRTLSTCHVLEHVVVRLRIQYPRY